MLPSDVVLTGQKKMLMVTMHRIWTWHGAKPVRGWVLWDLGRFFLFILLITIL